MKKTIIAFLGVLALFFVSEGSANKADRQAIIDTNIEVRNGFVSQDIPKILLFHHPEVEKVLAWDNYQKGHDDLSKALGSAFENHVLSFQGSVEDMESLMFFEQTAVMIAQFSVKGTPKKEGVSPFVFKGRTMIVYVRSAQSPTGWVTIREMIVPEK